MTRKGLSRGSAGSGRPRSNGKALISACLIGICCRFDGSHRLRKDFVKRLKGSVIVPICPEQLGGLSTPRRPAEIIGGDGFDVLRGRAKVIDSARQEVTQHFLKGAKEVLRVVRLNVVQKAYLKEGSPSCGTTRIVSRKTKRSGSGVTAALLIKEGMEVIGVR